jgi:hypothetical protein
VACADHGRGPARLSRGRRGLAGVAEYHAVVLDRLPLDSPAWDRLSACYSARNAVARLREIVAALDGKDGSALAAQGLTVAAVISLNPLQAHKRLLRTPYGRVSFSLLEPIADRMLQIRHVSMFGLPW